MARVAIGCYLLLAADTNQSLSANSKRPRGAGVRRIVSHFEGESLQKSLHPISAPASQFPSKELQRTKPVPCSRRMAFDDGHDVGETQIWSAIARTALRSW